jgi:hypothetical protein
MMSVADISSVDEDYNLLVEAGEMAGDGVGRPI